MEEIYLHEPRTERIFTDGNTNTDFVAILILLFLMLAKGAKNQSDNTD